MKILYITTVGGTMPFFKSLIRELLDKGNNVDIASNNDVFPVPKYYQEWGCQIFSLSCTRSPLDKGNFIAIKEIKKLVWENHYDIIHCHTPIAAACTRIACREVRKKGSKVFYTAHGFHFYKGAPFKNWLLYYPVEWVCSHWTDVLFTINKEDFSLAEQKFKMKKVIQIPGVGLDLNKFFYRKDFERDEYRKGLGIKKEDFMILSVGELNDNKNHILIIRAIAALNNKRIHYCIAGEGENRVRYLKEAEKLGIKEQVHILGFRNDIIDLNHAADLFAFPSIREGLGMASLEALACGTIVIGMDTRGIRDYVIEQKTGFLFDNQVKSAVKCIKESMELSIEEREKMREKCIKQVSCYNKIYTNEIMEEAYYSVLQ